MNAEHAQTNIRVQTPNTKYEARCVIH